MSSRVGDWAFRNLGWICLAAFIIAVAMLVSSLNRTFPERVDDHIAIVVSTWVEQGFGRSAQTLVEFPDGTRATRRGILGKEGDEVMTWKED